MSEIEKSARRARSRLFLNRWLSVLGWSLAGGAGIFVLAVGIQRVFALVEEVGRFYGWLALGLLVAAGAVSMIWAMVTRDDLKSSAARLDKAAGLKERISSGLYCAGSDDPFARAVVADAERVSRGLSIRHHLPVRVPDSAAWAGGSVLLAGLFFLVFPTLDLAGKQEDRVNQREKEARVKRAEIAIRPLIQPDIKKLREDHPELDKDLQELEALKDAKLDTPGELRQELMKKIEKIGDKLEDQAREGDKESIKDFKQMMRKLSADAKSDSPVNDLSQALAKGDLEAAQEALAKVQQQLTQAAKTPEEKQKADQMKADLKNLSDKLNEIAADQKKLNEQMAKAGLSKEDIQKAMENLKKGDTEALQKQLEQKGMTKQQAQQAAQQMKKQCDAGSMASKLAGNMAKASSAAGQNGQPMDASDMQGLTDAAQQLSDMEQAEQELNQLQSSMAQVNAMKNKVGQSCSSCNGSGTQPNGQPCASCNGSGMGQQGQTSSGGQGGGMGNLGQGQGGIAPLEATDFNTVNRQAQVHTERGAIISTKFIDGEQIKGDVSKDFIEATLGHRQEAAENISQEKTPRPYRKSVMEYFDRTQVGRASPPKPEAAPAK